MDLLRFQFTFPGPVGPGRYPRHGLGLMALKLSVDTAVVGLATGRPFLLARDGGAT